MQDIVFYAIANQTLGTVCDYVNEHRPKAPILTIGSAVCLRMRLFASDKGTAPYPIDSFSGIVSWQWSMDSVFDRRTPCKLVADEGGISVHTVTDTINGETTSFTEFVIPISNMETDELTAWLGEKDEKGGLHGELLGYDSRGKVAFVFLIKDFKIQNRMSGLYDPTAVDEGIVTRPVAEQMIQTAVSASAATKQDKLTSTNAGTGKQDKLTSTNAGTGISISSSGVISVSSLPQSSVSGLSASLAAKQDSITAGYRMAIVSGSTVDQARYFAIEPTITASANQTKTVVLCAGKAYEIHVTATNAKVLLNREEPPSVRTFGLEGHMEIFVANTGCVQTGANVVLINALEPDAVNNCTVRFHDGLAIISVEDHVAGYIVTVNVASGSGSLAYGLASATNEYISIDASLNGQTLDLAGVTTSAGEKHVVGNGYAETIITGGITCTSKTTFSNLSMLNTVVSSGTMTLGDVYIPSGSTVSASGGAIGIEKVSGNEGVIDFGGKRVSIKEGTISGITISGAIGSSWSRPPFLMTGTLDGVRITGNGDRNTEIVGLYDGSTFVAGGVLRMNSCYVGGNAYNANVLGGIYVAFTTLELSGSTITEPIVTRSDSGSASYVVVIGSNFLNSTIRAQANQTGGTVVISSGATVDLTGNTNTTPIAPGGGITLYGGPMNSTTKIIGSAGSVTQMRTFEDAIVSGTSISKIGAIYGATITDVPGPGYSLTYTTDNGSTSNTVGLNDTAPTDVTAEYGSSAGVLSVLKSNS